ncbi:MAG: DUF3160 domain-containing protein [Armatimonadota bacterium]
MFYSNRKIFSIAIIVLLIVAIGVFVLKNKSAGQTENPVSPPLSQSNADEPKIERAQFKFASPDLYDQLKKETANIKPAVASYQVKPDLSNVANRNIFKDALTPEHIKLLAKNGFVVSPTDYIQLFQVYENNEYQRPEKYPAFITTDAMLHQYHIFYDYNLREIESNKLFDVAVKLTNAMLAASQKDFAAAKNSEVKDAARRNVAYFAVARELLTGQKPPSEAADIANADLKLIMAHQGRTISNIMKQVKIDYSQFNPRGHYTRSEKLKKYFRGLMWYGLTPFPIPQGGIGEGPTIQALLVVRNLETAKAGTEPVKKLWDTIFEPTAFYVGTADDYTLYEYGSLSDRVYGKNPSIEAFGDEVKLTEFIGYVRKMPGPRIEHFVADSRDDSSPDSNYPIGRQFRFMGQRFIPDSRIMQELTHDKVNGRNFPKGLDVFAAMGSDRALDILDSYYSVFDFQGYQSQMDMMRGEMNALQNDTWMSNLYYGWLWSLKSVVEPAPEGYPSFMRNDAWIDKSLFTALGSWTELRHDTILYAKQSVTECGGGEDPVPIPKGYVEPNLEFWTKLKWLNDSTLKGLKSRSLLSPKIQSSFEQLGDWIDFCRNITIKELTNQKVTEEEYLQMEMFGADLESTFLAFAGGDIISDTDKDMAVVADVHTSFDKVMEEGVGHAAQIFVVVPIEGKLYLTRGAVFTQYEFEHPSSDRLTDEKWQEMLKTRNEPGFAEWIKTFFIHTPKKPAPQFENYFGGC